MTGIERVEAMNEVSERTFNINRLLVQLYDSVRQTAEDTGVDLVFDMDTSLPRRLRGNPDGLLDVFGKLLDFVLKVTPNKEVVLSIHAPEEFLYQECTEFRIENSGIAKAELQAFVVENLQRELESVEGGLKSAEGKGADLVIGVQLKNWYLGFRRHYRLPRKELVGKRVTLVCGCPYRARSMRHMFEYFNYDVTLLENSEAVRPELLEKNDIVCLCERLLSDEVTERIAAAQKSKELKYVVMRDSDKFEESGSARSDANFIKPVTQEKVLHLIIALYDESFPDAASLCIV